MEEKLPALLGKYDRQTNQPTTIPPTDDGRTDRVIGKLHLCLEKMFKALLFSLNFVETSDFGASPSHRYNLFFKCLTWIMDPTAATRPGNNLNYNYHSVAAPIKLKYYIIKSSQLARPACLFFRKSTRHPKNAREDETPLFTQIWLIFMAAFFKAAAA